MQIQLRIIFSELFQPRNSELEKIKSREKLKREKSKPEHSEWLSEDNQGISDHYQPYFNEFIFRVLIFRVGYFESETLLLLGTGFIVIICPLRTKYCTND